MKSATIMKYGTPAAEWDAALPIGNGRLGAMVYGGTARETIQLNEDSLWSGPFRDRNNPDALENLARIREAITAGRLGEAERVAHEALCGLPVSQRVYQSAGELLLDFFPPVSDGSANMAGAANPSAVTDYSRELDLERGVLTVRFSLEGVTHTREYFASAPDSALVIRLRASAAGAVSFRAVFDRGVFVDRLSGEGSDAIVMERDGDIPFCAMVRVVTVGGRSFVRGGFLNVETADEALLFVDIRTGFREREPRSACAANLERVAAKGIFPILADHIADFRALTGRAAFSLGPSLRPEPAEPTDLLLARSSANAAPSPELLELYWCFSRYLLVSSSRPGTLPANLQGIWNRHLDPPWGSKFTININTQMNYWPAALCALPEFELPLFDLLERAYPNGKKTARVMYGCAGFVAHHNTDMWGDTAPQDHWTPATPWLLGAAWLAIHVRRSYEITGDSATFRRFAYLMIEACRFFSEYLVPLPGSSAVDAPLVVFPSASPENTYLAASGESGSLSAGCAMDSQILRELFALTIRSLEEFPAAELYRESAKDADAARFRADLSRFRAVLARLQRPAIHSNGTIREWNEEFGEAEPGHRHVSHLWALFPGEAIDPERTPELAKAARETLNRRLAHGGGHTGWSRAWIVNFRASLGDGEGALADLSALFAKSTLPNLFDNHPPFQIDGNFGALAGMTRMIAQGRLEWGEGDDDGATPAAQRSMNYARLPLRAEIRLLPALPAAWPEGSISGIRLPGGLSLSLSWKNGRPERIGIGWNGSFARKAGDGGDGLFIRLAFAGSRFETEITTGKRLPESAFGARLSLSFDGESRLPSA